MRAFTTPAEARGANIPRYSFVILNEGFDDAGVVDADAFDAGVDNAVFGFSGEDVCSRTLYVSNGCPTTTLNEPAKPPAIRSCKAVTFGVLVFVFSDILLTCLVARDCELAM